MYILGAEGEVGLGVCVCVCVCGRGRRGEEDLGDGGVVGLEAALPRLHEEALADSGAGLFFLQLGGAAFEAEATHAEADGARGNDDDLGAGGAQGGDAGAHIGDAAGIQ